MNALRIGVIASIAAFALSEPMHAETSVVKDTAATSTFDSKAIERDPVLPIGWKKKTLVRERPLQPIITPDAFRVTSIIAGGVGAGLAIINGRGYAAGESVVISVGGHEVGVLVKEVNDGEVVFLHNGQNIRASLINR